MPRIKLKPNSAEFADSKPAAAKRHCNMPGCSLEGEYRAPKDRALSDYYWFCLDHVREYNQAWNYFSGMSDHEVEDHVVKSYYGDRPTWRYDMPGAAEEALRRKARQTHSYTEREPPTSGQKARSTLMTPEGEALAIMGLETPITLEEIKARYKALVKKHHPDVNRGDPKSEELLKSINMAYTILKLAYEQFKELPKRN
jgi:hypothetical protein